jgi:hypothetical protein
LQKATFFTGFSTLLETLHVPKFLYSSILWEAAEHVAQFVEWRRHKSRDSLERRFVRGSRMAAGRNEHLGAFKALAHILRFPSRQGLFERREVVSFFLLNVPTKF